MKASTGEKLTVTITLFGEDLERMREFQLENGFPSLNIAARALCLGAISIYPSWGITRAMVEMLAFEIRQRLLTETYSTLSKTQAKIEEELSQLVQPGEQT